MDTQRIAVLSDAHYPFHDPHAIALALKVCAMWQPHRVILNGDLLDFYSLSRFEKDPARLNSGGLQVEIDLFTDFCGRLRDAVPQDTQIDYLPGNHEMRLVAWLWKNAGVYGLHALELPTLLELSRFGITYYADEIPLADGALIVKHGRVVRRNSGQSAMGELEAERFQVSTITGHTHRLASVFVQTRRGVIAGFENGCLCSLTPEYMAHPNWQHGMTICHVEGDRFSAQSVPFLGSGESMKAVVEGSEVRL